MTTEIKLIVRSNTAAIRQCAPVHTTVCSQNMCNVARPVLSVFCVIDSYKYACVASQRNITDGGRGSRTTFIVTQEFLPLQLSVNSLSEVHSRASLLKRVVISC